MKDLQELVVIVTADMDGFTKKINEGIKLMKEFKRASKLSLWIMIKLRIMKIFITKPKITIQELIDKERNK